MTNDGSFQRESPSMPETADEAWSDALVSSLRAIDIRAVAYVPDEGSGRVITSLESDPDVTAYSVTREEEGVGILTGAQLGGVRGVLIMQASGLGNSLNALASVNVPCRVPILLVIGERGGLNEFNPCQIPGGRAVPAYLDAIGIPTFRVDSPTQITAVIEGSEPLAFEARIPVAIILSTRLTKGSRS